jgi:hypothetical protein
MKFSEYPRRIQHLRPKTFHGLEDGLGRTLRPLVIAGGGQYPVAEPAVFLDMREDQAKAAIEVDFGSGGGEIARDRQAYALRS